MMVAHFPRALLREGRHSWNLIGRAKTPGTTADSFAPIVRSDGGGFWSCVMRDISLSGLNGAMLNDRERQRRATLLWRAVRQLADGGVNSLVVPRNDALFIPFPADAERVRAAVLHSNGETFSDGSGYYQSVIEVLCDGGAGERATSMSLTLVRSGDLVGGEAFSIDHETVGWRMYEIATVDYAEDGQVNITFLPPLREAIADGASLEFERPCCTMRLVKTNSMDLDVRPWSFNSASVDFIEAPAGDS
jgi:hypothetical protein